MNVPLRSTFGLNANDKQKSAEVNNGKKRDGNRYGNQKYYELYSLLLALLYILAVIFWKIQN